ncbi:tocopherol O-methyltransferase [Prosthecobacter debontii]|uniref:Tocopherol O-methyltransferase n=1 Tax=Prosthecobacter debontii TaxID=48467 RepID=A0A1T4YW83_9BACT|nr:methyltransferase domain-containing protein [Prosthecobacter debontii]SKB06049.1 tocopherol O-methyltransferase [Prosthecobacter debontii]
MIESTLPATPTEVAGHYDQLDRFYREIWGDHVHHGLWITGKESSDQATRNLMDAVVTRARLKAGMHLCDVGCGYGQTSRIIAREQQVKVTGLTISPAQLRYAQQATEPGLPVEFLLRDWQHNNLPDASFDAVIAVESTEHMQDKARVFSEAARVLKPGGRLVVCAWLAAEQPTPWEDRHLLEPICREGRMPSLGTATDLVRWMTAAGLSVESSDDVSLQVMRTWPICAWRFIRGVITRPSYLRFLLDPKHDNRIFGLTMLRLWLAYRTGAMRYVIFQASKSGAQAGADEIRYPL